MSNSNVVTKKLTNGLTIVTVDLPGFHSLTNMVVTRTGGRYETANEHGLAHFLEHMVFKGTKSFPSPEQLSEAMEGIGGFANAWTSHECTAYWNVVPADHYKLGVQQAIEMAFQPLLPEADMDKERGVIIEEIRRAMDKPGTILGNIAQKLSYNSSGLGRTVIGTEESVTALTHQQLVDYHARHYNPAQTYFVSVGAVSSSAGLLDYATELLSNLPAKTVSTFTPDTTPSGAGLELFTKDTQQAHFGFTVSDPLMSLISPRRYVGVVLSTILGSGMSSRLFMNIRERKGLAYSVGSSPTIYEDTGDIFIYGAVNVKKIDEAIQAVKDELKTLITTPVSDAELTKAKNMITGSMDIDADSPSDLINWYGTSALLGMNETPEEAKAAVEQVTAEQIQELAAELFTPERMTLVIVGPYDSDEQFKKFLQP